MSSTPATPPLSTGDVWIGYAACLLSCVGFGLMFLPVRKADCRDGFFVQWVQCSVVFIVGCCIYIWRGFPSFEPIAAIGGLLYATGNIFSVPIVQGIGIGIGMLIWGTIQVLVGWGVARFGLFSFLDPSPVKNDVLNYIGMVVTVICGILFVFVRHNHENPEKEAEERAITGEGDAVEMNENGGEKSSKDEEAASGKPNSKWTSVIKKLPFVGMAVCLGIIHGLMMSPVDAAKQRRPAALKIDKFYMFDFVFSYFSAVFFASTIYFLLYALVRRSRAHVKAELVLPSALYGIFWSIGMSLWFLSADRLEQTVAYPITTRLPAIIGALLDIFVFRSISGLRNIGYLSGVILLGIIGVVLIALSNQDL